jgi:2-oxoisovalerate dehydrogenase E1 component
MLQSRALDVVARELRATGKGYYTIGSSGHESNAFIAHATKPSDPALLHYRSGGFYCHRANISGLPIDPVRDVLLGMFASTDEPIAGGRHKVFGRHELSVIPQTSTIASHLPRAVGLALTLGRSAKFDVDLAWPDDAVVVCSFGDASVNHSTATGALNTAAHIAHQGLPLPVLFVCEDNGIGISTRTPRNWIEASYENRNGLSYISLNGDDPQTLLSEIPRIVENMRLRRRPVFLHLKTVRFGGHAGTDVETAYRSREEIRSEYARDPILAAARHIVETGIATSHELLTLHDEVFASVRNVAAALADAPELSTREDVLRPLAPRRPALVAAEVQSESSPEQRIGWFEGALPEHTGPLTFAQSVNAALNEALLRHPGMLVFGEDVAAKGGVYGVTKGLQRRAGAARIFDTVLDEQSIIGMALGAGIAGLLPVAEIQYLAYLHNAEDQLRGEAASLQFFSDGKFRNPLVLRISSYGYQKGFGGHFHNDNAIAVLRDIPGLVIASPSKPEDAAAMLRTCIQAADTDGTVSAFLEPIALLHTADLHEPGDRRWLAPYRAPSKAQHVAIGEPAVAREGSDVLIATWGNGLWMSLRVAERLAQEGIEARVLDLRWLAPLPLDEVLRHAQECNRVLVVDETRRSGGPSEAILAHLAEAGFRGLMRRVCAADSFVPLGAAANLVLVQEDEIEAAVRSLAFTPTK